MFYFYIFHSCLLKMSVAMLLQSWLASTAAFYSNFPVELGNSLFKLNFLRRLPKEIKSYFPLESLSWQIQGNGQKHKSLLFDQFKAKICWTRKSSLKNARKSTRRCASKTCKTCKTVETVLTVLTILTIRTILTILTILRGESWNISHFNSLRYLNCEKLETV